MKIKYVLSIVVLFIISPFLLVSNVDLHVEDSQRFTSSCIREGRSNILNSMIPNYEVLTLNSELININNLAWERSIIARNVANVEDFNISGNLEFKPHNYNIVNHYLSFNRVSVVRAQATSVTASTRAIFDLSINCRLYVYVRSHNANPWGSRILITYSVVPGDFFNMSIGTNQMLYVHYVNGIHRYEQVRTFNILSNQRTRVESNVFHNYLVDQTITHYAFSNIQMLFDNEVIHDFGGVSSNQTHIMDFNFYALTNDRRVLNALFDRNLRTSLGISLRFIPTTWGNNAHFQLLDLSFGIDFRINHEFILDSFVFNVAVPDSSSLGLQFLTFDYQHYVLNKIYVGNGYRGSPLNNQVGDRVVQLPNRLREVYGFGFNIFAYTDSRIDIPHETGLVYLFSIYHLNVFNFGEFSRPPIVTPPNTGDWDFIPPLQTQSCNWFDVFCHIQNAVVWLLTDFPPVAIIYSGFVGIINFLSNSLMAMLSLVGINFSFSGYSYQTYFFGGFMSFITSALFIIIVWKFIKLLGGLF